MMRRVVLMVAVLLVPVLLAVAGSVLSAPSGPPDVDAQPVEMRPGPDGMPAPGLEPARAPSQEPSGPAPSGEAPAEPAPSAPAPAPPAPPPVPAPAPAPVPVVPPVVIDDDDDDFGDD